MLRRNNSLTECYFSCDVKNRTCAIALFFFYGFSFGVEGDDAESSDSYQGQTTVSELRSKERSRGGEKMWGWVRGREEGEGGKRRDVNNKMAMRE